MRYFLFFLSLFFFSSSSLRAQLPVLEQVSGQVKWYSIDTENFRILFQEENEPEAQRTAAIMERLYEPLSLTLDHKPRKINVVLQNRNFISNGFVSLQPWKTEFYTTPTMDNALLGTSDWVELLATHEFRHVVQLDKINTGFNRFLYYVFGNQVIAGIESIALPDWYLEGDATLMETVHSDGGRGRIPAFDREFKINTLDNKPYSYNKQSLGSFKDFVPDEYRLGYFMTTNLRKNYGEEVWEKIEKNAKSWPIIPFTFSNSIKKATGSYLVPTYNQLMEEMKSEYQQQIEGIQPMETRQLLKSENPVFTSYEFPQPLPSGDLVALKSGLADYQQFVRIHPDGTESVLYVPGFVSSTPMLSTSGRFLVWTQYQWHPRWLNQTYSVLKIMDTESGEVRTLSDKSKYHSAALDPSGERIVTVETNELHQHRIIILDSSTGQEIMDIENPKNDFYITPRFTEDGQSIVMVRHVGSQRGISLYNLRQGSWNHIIEPRLENISHPVHFRDHIYYNSPYNGIDNIYSVHLENKDIYQVTHSISGAYNPTFLGDQIVFNQIQVKGMELLSMEITPENWIPFEQIIDRNLNYFEPVLEQEEKVDLSGLDEKAFPVKRHPRGKSLFNAYNWGPIVDATTFDVQLGIYSTDMLNTNTISAGYNFDLFEGTGFWFGRYSYQGFFPILDFEVTSGNRQDDRLFRDSTGTVQEVRFKWDEVGFKTGLRLPFRWLNTRYIEDLSLNANYGLISVSNFNQNEEFREIFRDQLTNGNVQYMQYGISYSRLHKVAKRDIRSKLGQSLSINLQHTPFKSDFDESLNFYALGGLYFPGLFKHHSLLLTGGYQYNQYSEEASNNYIFRDNFSIPRGYGSTFFEDMTSISFNYALPLWHPDLGLGPFLYIQRFKLNGFYDHAWWTRGDLEGTLTSYGAELTANFNVMRYFPLFDLGVRWVYLSDLNENVYELVIGAVRF